MSTIVRLASGTAKTTLLMTRRWSPMSYESIVCVSCGKKYTPDEAKQLMVAMGVWIWSEKAFVCSRDCVLDREYFKMHIPYPGS